MSYSPPPKGENRLRYIVDEVVGRVVLETIITITVGPPSPALEEHFCFTLSSIFQRVYTS
jgi:hypothetical protein